MVDHLWAAGAFKLTIFGKTNLEQIKMWQEPEVPTSALKLCSYMYDTPQPVAASV